MAAATALQGAWYAMPETLKGDVPPHIITGVTIALLVLGFFGRLRDQSPAAKPKPTVPQANQ